MKDVSEPEFQLGEPIEATDIQRSSRYLAVYEAVERLDDGLLLPVTLPTTAKAKSLSIAAHRRKHFDLVVIRRKNIVYVGKKEGGAK